MTPYLLHILLTAGNDIDGETIMEYVYDTLAEGFDTVHDKVELERDISTNAYNKQQQLTISLIYGGVWRCQIHYNDDDAVVLHDSKQWSELYSSEYVIEDRKNIAQCRRRLDIVSDPDPQNDYYEDFYAISDYLRNILGQCYSFDPIQNRFLTNSY
jgi:hypothetical protein